MAYAIPQHILVYANLVDYGLYAFYREEALAEGYLKRGLLTLCGGGVWNYPNF